MSEYIELQDLPKGFVSYSQINMYKRCPQQYKYRYVDGLKMPPKSGLIIGQAVHSGLTEGFNEKIKSGGSDLKIVNLIKEKAVYELENLLSTTEVLYDENEDKDVLKDDTVKMSETYYKEIGKKLKPVEVKKPFEIQFSNVDWKLIGEIDIITDELIDWKTGKQKLSEEYIVYDEQLKLYKIVVSKKATIHQIVRYKKKDPQIYIYSSDFDEKVIKNTLQNVATIVQLIRTGYFYKRLDDKVCSWCGYKDLCLKGE